MASLGRCAGPTSSQTSVAKPQCLLEISDPNSGLRTGAAFQRGGVSGNLSFQFAQGSNRSITSTAPSITTMNGYPGSITSQTIRPFVTGVTPVVGDYPTLSAAPAGQQMRAAVQQSQAFDIQQRIAKSNNKKQQKALEHFNRGQRAETEGNLKMARANYRIALANAQGLLRVEVIKKMQARGWIK